MRTFEFKDATSQKFWTIDLQGTKFTVTYGRLGTKGQTQAKSFRAAPAAQVAHDKLVAEKVAKGYVETTGKKPAEPTALQKSLEAALVADSDDVAAHSAYADYLMEQGDPRGEFIQVQLSLEDPNRTGDERKKLQNREGALLKEHMRSWLGEDLAGHLIDNRPTWITPKAARQQFGFARGWLTTLQIRDLTGTLAAVLAKTPQLRLLRRLEIDDFDYDDEPDLSVVGKSSHFGNLRTLQLGGRGGPGGETAVALIRHLPRLEELHLMVHGVDTPSLFGLKTLTHLRVLMLYHLTEYPVEKLAANPAFSSLTHLLLWPHAVEPGDAAPYLRLPQLRAVLRSKHFPNLTHLEWRVSDIGDDGCQEIVNSGIFGRLKSLDLTSGCITDAGARLLAACPDLRKLELLDVSRNRLTRAGVNMLKKTGVNLVASHQHGEVDAEDYLYEGDIE